jgi:hypothetical protein
MPAPEFKWSTYQVRVPINSPLRALSTKPSIAEFALAPTVAAQTMAVQLPDLGAWPSPLDKAEILLESAAEIEHALMVQYLYAAYSLKSSDEVTDPAQQAALDETSADSWPRVLLGIAREEMGHLMTVQNLLLLLGLPPNFEREDFPPRKELYPFSLHLERLSQKSLAKYVVAEAPVDAAGIADIIQIAQESAGAMVNHVGVLYGLLGLVFATRAQVQESDAGDGDAGDGDAGDGDADDGDADDGGSGSAGWDAMVRHLALAAYQQAPPDAWHLPDSAFDPRTVPQQADPEDWQVSGLRVHRLANREAARQAIRDIGEQGEGPTNEGAQSHFERFRGIYRGQNGLPPFPAEPPTGDWVPTREVPTDPKVGVNLIEPRTKRWAELADARYALLLGFVEHYLLTSGGDRRLLTGWIFAEMRSRVGFMARQLTAMPSGGTGTAGIPFSLPSALHLPGAESARWAIHKERTDTAIAKVEGMQSADSVDQADSYLSDLLASDRARLAFIISRTIPSGATTSFVRDVLPLFRPKDIQHMNDLGLDLSQYEVVKNAAPTILDRVQNPGGRVMPPEPDPRWTKAQVDLFAQWIKEDFPR